VFLVLPMLIGGIVAGIGLEWLGRLVERRRARWRIVTACLAVALAVAQYRANEYANNQHRHGFEAAYFDALFAQLPSRAAIVEESYPIDHMVLYKLVGEHAAGRRTIALIPSRADVVTRYLHDGFAVYAFENGQRQLEAEGVGSSIAPLALPQPLHVRHIIDTEAQELAFPLARIGSSSVAKTAAVQP
jgi:hypothetical protein